MTSHATPKLIAALPCEPLPEQTAFLLQLLKLPGHLCLIRLNLTQFAFLPVLFFLD
jgi:hypothetical protein